MLFVSYEFIGFVLLLLLLYYLMPGRQQWKLLLGASFLFYFLSDPRYLLYIIATIVSIYIAACRLERTEEEKERYIREKKALLSKEEKKAYKQKIKRKKWYILLVCLIFNIAVLAIVKYTNFAISNVNSVLRLAGSSNQFAFLNILVPMGISFYTFQALGYLIDVYRGVVQAEKNPFKLALFISFFPQLIQGPISRFGELKGSLFAEHRFQADIVCRGLQRVLWGYFKKMVIADRILIGVNSIIRTPEKYTGIYVFLGMLFYALELYADFTGGIDITIGIAEAMGIKITENFNRPYFSKSVKEYWRRWHITMGTWFADYIFYPISICKPMLHFSRRARARFGERIGKRLPVYLSSFAVWFATGIWHGASWNFIVWGLGNWAVIMISQELEPLYERFHKLFAVRDKLYFRVFQVARTVLLMSCLRMLDCYRNVPLTFKMFGSMLTERNWHILWDGSLQRIGLNAADYLILILGTVCLIAVSLIQRKGSVRDQIAVKPYPVKMLIWFGMFLIILLMGAYGTGYDASQFIYNQF